MKKSQIYSYELMFVVVFVVILFLVIAFTQYRYITKVDSDVQYDKMKETAKRLSDTLLGSGGYPDNWEMIDDDLFDKVEVFGLANGTNVLDMNKVTRFFELMDSEDFELVKEKLGLSIYQFRIEIDLLELEKEEYGDEITANNVVVLNRNILYDGTQGLISFVIAK